MGKKLLTALGLAGGIALISSLSNFGAKEESAEKAVQSCQQIYTQMLKENNFNRREYLKQCDIIERGLIKDINSLYGTRNDLEKRKEWAHNLKANFKGTNNNFHGGFDDSIKMLQNLATSPWREFVGNPQKRAQTANEQFMNFQTALISAHQKLIEVSKTTYSKNTNTEYNQYDNKLRIQNYTLTQSYQLFEWYRQFIFLKIELWRCNNPVDAKATQGQFEELKRITEELDFSQFANK